MARKIVKTQENPVAAAVRKELETLRESVEKPAKTATVLHLPSKTKKSTDTKAPPTGLQKGAEAEGFALAQSAIKATETEGNVWNRFVLDLVGLSVEARGWFIKTIRQHLNADKVDDKEAADKYFHRTTKASGNVRLSELVAIAKTMNIGWEPQLDAKGQLALPFYKNLAEAKTILKSEAAAGDSTGAMRGRKREAFVVRLVKYVARFEVLDSEEQQRDAIMAHLRGAFPAEFKAAQEDLADKGAKK